MGARAENVCRVAYLYIEHHMEVLMHLEGAQKIDRKMQQESVFMTPRWQAFSRCCQGKTLPIK